MLLALEQGYVMHCLRGIPKQRFRLVAARNIPEPELAQSSGFSSLDLFLLRRPDGSPSQASPFDHECSPAGLYSSPCLIGFRFISSLSLLFIFLMTCRYG